VDGSFGSGNENSHFPRSGEMAGYHLRWLTYAPTGLSFSTARRRDLRFQK
jgi:hypothetical protein